MADRIITFYIPEKTGTGTNQGMTFYIEDDYVPDAVRIHAKVAPLR